MCRTMVFIRPEANRRSLDNDLEAAKHVLLNQMKQSLKHGNVHGFTVGSYPGTDPVVARTPSSVDWVNETLSRIEGSHDRVFHLHARKATLGNARNRYIHGWEREGWMCTHNGTVMLPEELEVEDNDSLNLYNALFSEITNPDDPNAVAASLRHLLETSVEAGTGTFILTNPDHTIVASMNRSTYFYLIDERYLSICSASDIMDMDSWATRRVTFPARRRSKTTQMGQMTFPSDILHEEIYVDTPYSPTSTQQQRIMNEIVVINNNTREIENRVPMAPVPSFVERHEYY